MPQLHRDNHYVPQLYLKQWAADDRILTYSLLVPHENVRRWKAHSPKGIAFHQHLYTSIVNGNESDELEKWLDREFEAPAEDPLSLVTRDGRLNSDDWRKLVRFALAQDVRTPARLREFLQRQAELLPPMLDNVVKNVAEKLMRGEILKYSDDKIDNRIPLRVSLEASDDTKAGIMCAETLIGRSLWHWSIRHLLTSTIAKVPMKGWTIRKPALGYTWPTSDNPLIKLNYRDELNYNFGGGWEVPKGDVFLPLSPTHLLHRCGGVRPPFRGHRVDVATTQKIIRVIVEHADRYVFAQQEFNIESIRKRTVDENLVKQERAMWKNWHADQIQAERDY
ncbi:DUF4238 domain-containing protein [Xanthomonas graminis]|uniref:DUF4238 domain-containing protein n=1 Tax=Xanthomonas graminis TaxID=3390026 RepID=UPI0009BF19B4|nr:DUF4238 domain-containing protein [Xanthomonas translucens]